MPLSFADKPMTRSDAEGSGPARAGDRAYRGRFAPSPTGDLHLGGVATALFAAARVIRSNGALVLRVEDLDTQRVVPGSEEAQLFDLAWLGLRFDEGPVEGGPHAPYRQSERLDVYERALELLAERGHTYLCDCSRADIARAASAPHEGEEGPRYPGTCRSFGMAPRNFRRPAAVRLRVPEGYVVRWRDVRTGLEEALATDAMGDFVLRRGDGVFAYQLATAVDDVAMEITEVVRGDDLRPSAPRQALIAELVGAEAPAYLHVPLLLGRRGDRLAKRAGGMTVRAERERGVSPGRVLADVATAYGHAVPPEGDVLGAVAALWDPARLPMGSVAIAALGGER
jgi:glutamyl-tRNA synthetase